MARCGCVTPSGVCNCAVQAGANVSVTGTGSAESPYVISTADPASARGYVQVTDTDTINQTLAGTGTFADPYILSADAVVDPDESNLLQAGANGLIVTCAAVIGCVGAESPGEGGAIDFGCGLDGVGTPGDPIVVVPQTGVARINDTQAGPFAFPTSNSVYVELPMTNPSDCADALAQITVRGTIDYTVTAGERWETEFRYGWQDLSPGGDVQASFAAGKGATGGESGASSGLILPPTRTFAPGETQTFRARVQGVDGIPADDFHNVRITIVGLMLIGGVAV